MSLVRLPPLLPAPAHPPLALPDEARRTVIYPASEALLVLRRPTADGPLAYQTSLAFPSLPSTRTAAATASGDALGQPLGPVAADPAGERIASSAGRRVCVWERRAVEDLTNGWGPRRSSLEEEVSRDGCWVVHSTVTLPAPAAVTRVVDAADEEGEDDEAVIGLALSSGACCSMGSLTVKSWLDRSDGDALVPDRLAVQTKNALYYYTTDLAAPAPLWTLLWNLPLRLPSSSTSHQPATLKPTAVPPVISPNGRHLAFCSSTGLPRTLGSRRPSRSIVGARIRHSESATDVRILTLHADGCLRKPPSCGRSVSRAPEPGQALQFSSTGRRLVTGLEWWKDGASDGRAEGAQVLLTSTAYANDGQGTLGRAPAVHFHAPVLDDPGFFALIHTLSAPVGDETLHALPPTPGKHRQKPPTSETSKQRFAAADDGAVAGPVHIVVDVVGLAQSSSKLVTSTAAPTGNHSSALNLKQPSSWPPSVEPSWTTALDAATLVQTARGHAPVAVPVLESSSAASASRRQESAPAASSVAMRKGSIQRLHRTPNGRSVLIEGSVEMVVLSLVPSSGKRQADEWSARARWDRREGEALWALFARGRSIVSWDRLRREVSIRYLRPKSQQVDDGQSEPLAATGRTLLPGLPKDETLTTLIGLSNIDDGISPSSLTPSHSLVLAASASGRLYTWSLVRSEGPVGEASHEPKVELLSTFVLPTSTAQEGDAESGSIVDILPVDPMAWRSTVVDWSGTGPSGDTGGVPRPLQDLLLVVRAGGQLEYWSPWEGGFARGHSWSLGGCVRTGKTLAMSGTTLAGGREEGADGRSPVRIRCSSAKKTVLVSWKTDESLVAGQPGAQQQELTIWDSKSSEFYSGLEYAASYPSVPRSQMTSRWAWELTAPDTSRRPESPILDLDWTSTPDKASVLAVGFRDHVLLLCEQQMSYLAASDGDGAEHASYWAPLLTIPVALYEPTTRPFPFLLAVTDYLVPVAWQLDAASDPRLDLAVGGNACHRLRRYPVPPLTRDPLPVGRAQGWRCAEERPRSL
jgi:hypothetical protein